MATYRKAEDLINIGAYVKGSSSQIDDALLYVEKVNGFLRQGTDDSFKMEDTVRGLAEIFACESPECS